MATYPVELPAKTWVEIDEEKCTFQFPDQKGGLAIESVEMPVGTDVRMRMNPGQIYFFNKFDGKLYVRSETDSSVSISPKA